MRLRALPLAISALAITLAPAHVALAASFYDVPSYSEFADDIQALADDGVVSGIAPGYFGPNLNATRGELAKIVMRASGRDVPTASTSRFRDVPSNSPFLSSIEAAAEQGVIGGYSDGTFRPDAPVTRGEAAKMVVRAFSVDINTTGGPHFSDVPGGYSLYSEIESARNASIISGYSDGTFRPNAAIIRAHLAKIVNRARSGGTFSSGTLRFKVNADARKIANDGVSTTLITISAEKKSDGDVDNTYDNDVEFRTSAGHFLDSGDASEDTEFKGGRAQVTLQSSTTEETARVTARVNGSTIASISIEFSTDAPHTNEGKGVSSIAGVGTMRLTLYDSKVLTTTKASPFQTNFSRLAGGASLIEVEVSDSNGDPIDGDSIRATILVGDGRLENGAFPTTGPANATSQRSVTLVSEGRGRYLGWYQATTSQIPGTVTIETLDLRTSPVLSTRANLSVHTPILRGEMTQNRLLTRRIGSGVVADIRNRSEILVETLDENGLPVALGDNAATINARVIAGGTGDAYLGTVPANSTSVTATPVSDVTPRQIPGLYAIAYTAGSTPGTTDIELRATDAIGQPRTVLTLRTEDPKIETLVTSTTIGAGQTSTVLVKVVDWNGVPVTGENLQAVVQSGPGSLNSIASGSGSTVTLDTVPTAPGFYTATFQAPGNVATSQSVQIRITDLSRVQLVQGVVTIQLTPSNNFGVETTMLLTPLRTSIGALDSVPVMITLRDSRGIGIAGAAARLTPKVVVGSGTVSPVVELGNGAYVVTYSANRSVGNIRIQVQDLVPNAAAIVQEVSFNVADNRIAVEPVNDHLLIDEGTGVLTFVRDEDNIPIPGLLNPGFTPPTVGNVTFSNITEIEPSVLGVGSGVYIIGVDSSNLTPPGTMTVRVTETGAATAPFDQAVLDFKDVSLELHSEPTDDVLSTTCLVLVARVTDQVGDPVNGATVQFEIAQGSGQLSAGNPAGSCPAGTNRVTVGDSEGSSSTDNRAGVYVATFRASGVSENVRVTARVTNSATQVEQTIPIRVR